MVNLKKHSGEIEEHSFATNTSNMRDENGYLSFQGKMKQREREKVKERCLKCGQMRTSVISTDTNIHLILNNTIINDLLLKL